MKLSRFNHTFCEPVSFSDGSLVLSQELFPTAAAALAELAEYFGKPVDAACLRADAVRFGFPPWPLSEEYDHPIWVAGATGKGAKAVWIYRP